MKIFIFPIISYLFIICSNRCKFWYTFLLAWVSALQWDYVRGVVMITNIKKWDTVSFRDIHISDYHCIVTITNPRHHYLNIIMICYSKLIYNSINIFQFIFPQRHDSHFVFQVTLSNIMAGCRIIQRGPQAKLLRVAQFFWQVQKVVLVLVCH